MDYLQKYIILHFEYDATCQKVTFSYCIFFNKSILQKAYILSLFFETRGVQYKPYL